MNWVRQIKKNTHVPLDCILHCVTQSQYTGRRPETRRSENCRIQQEITLSSPAYIMFRYQQIGAIL
jgi:hypothetical protein